MPFVIDQTLLCGSVTISMYLYVHIHVHVHVHIYVFVYIDSSPIYTKKIPVSTVIPKLAYFMKKIISIKWKIHYLSDHFNYRFTCILILIFSLLPLQLIPSFLANLLTWILDSFSSWLFKALAVVIISSVFCTFNLSSSTTCHENSNTLTSLLP